MVLSSGRGLSWNKLLISLTTPINEPESPITCSTGSDYYSKPSSLLCGPTIKLPRLDIPWNWQQPTDQTSGVNSGVNRESCLLDLRGITEVYYTLVHFYTLELRIFVHFLGSWRGVCCWDKDSFFGRWTVGSVLSTDCLVGGSLKSFSTHYGFPMFFSSLFILI